MMINKEQQDSKENKFRNDLVIIRDHAKRVIDEAAYFTNKTGTARITHVLATGFLGLIHAIKEKNDD